MTATLRVVLDQLGAGAPDPNLAIAERELARALVRSAPTDCVVAALVPAGDEVATEEAVPGLASVSRTMLARRELAAAWQRGLATGSAHGMVHAPSLFAPVGRHDRVHDGNQTVVTLWDLRAWERPDSLPRGTVSWQRAMLRRAEKHADAVVVPTHAMAAAVGAHSRLERRVRVIPGAAPAGFAPPVDAAERRRTFQVAEGALVLDGSGSQLELTSVLRALVDADLALPLVVFDADPLRESWLVDAAREAGYPVGSLHVRGALPDQDRAAILSGAAAYLAPATDSGFPWRMLEALALGVPVVAVESPVHEELLLDGGVLVTPEDFGAAVSSVLESDAARRRWSVLAADRGRAFSWDDAAARVWALHAEL
ncbi:glycosyltransferase [Microbacterium sp. X-17]|uniref:glycosyltransferase n=1 Tax=Microbacterium sp. X-17 TaxID=3144404 RepID=UPI0031F53514